MTASNKTRLVDRILEDLRPSRHCACCLCLKRPEGEPGPCAKRPSTLHPKGKSIPAAQIVPGGRYRVTGFGYWDLYGVHAQQKGLYAAVFIAEPSPEGYASGYEDRNGYVRGQFRMEGTVKLYFFREAQLEELDR